MNLKRPCSTALQSLLLLGLLFALAASSMDARPLSVLSIFCEEVEEALEPEGVEDSQEHLALDTVLSFAIRETETFGSAHFCRAFGCSVFNGSTVHPAGWTMPLRI